MGSTVPAIIPSAIVGTIRYHRLGLVDWKVGLWCGGAGAISAAGGVWTSTVVDAHWLMVGTAFLMLYSAFSVLRSARTDAAPLVAAVGVTAPIDGVAPVDLVGPVERRGQIGWLVVIGLGAGFTAGLLGVGGGLIMVPAFTLVLRMQVKEIIASSLVAVAMMSVTSLIGHLIAGHIDWSYALPLAIGVIPGARLGSHFTAVASDRTMKLVCGALLVVFGIYYLATELQGAL